MMKMNSVAISGKYFLAIFWSCRLSFGHRRGQVVEHLDRGLQPTRTLLQATAPRRTCRPSVMAPRQQHVEDALVEVDRADAEPGVELELVGRREHAAGDVGALCGWKPKTAMKKIRPPSQKAADHQEDLLSLAHARLSRLAGVALRGDAASGAGAAIALIDVEVPFRRRAAHHTHRKRHAVGGKDHESPRRGRPYGRRPPPRR